MNSETLRRSMLGLVLVAAALASGCAVNRATATADPTLRWDSIKTLHVKKLVGEDPAPPCRAGPWPRGGRAWPSR